MAAEVLTQVIGVYPERGTALVDAGGLALSKDRAGQSDWGLVRGRPDLTLSRLSQECGVLERRAGAGAGAGPGPGAGAGATAAAAGEQGQGQGQGLEKEQPLPEMGALLRIVPNHACLTAACHTEFWPVRGDSVIGEPWRPCRGW